MWSPVEYAAHARDMVRVLGERTTAMLDADDPQFADWDGDAKNVELSYFRADPAAIAQDLAQQTARTASILREVGDRVVGAGGDDPAEVQPPRKSAAIPPQGERLMPVHGPSYGVVVATSLRSGATGR